MRIFVIHPGPNFSTADVFDGICTGLRTLGVQVIKGALDDAMAFQTALYAAGQKHGVVKEGPVNITQFVGPYMVQHAISCEPDAVIVVSAHNFNIASARVLRQAGLKTAMMATESPYFADFERRMAQAYDVVFTHERKCDAAYFDHPNVHYLPHAWNPDVHRPEGMLGEPAPDVFFVGSLFEERARLFDGVDWSGITFLRRGYTPGQDIQDIIENEETAAYYRSAKINLNHHRTTMEFGKNMHIADGSAESLGPRAYEIAACGSFQLMDDSRAEARDVFGEALVTYRAGDSADLERQIRTWLRRPDERARLAQAQHEAVRTHSWVDRARRMLEVLT